MRITLQAQRENRARILDVARRLFRAQGFDETTTRDLAAEAGIATGTLFNYFPTKEAIVMTLVADALDEGRQDYATRRRSEASQEEELFDFIAAGLRKLKPHRSYLRVALETAFGPSVHVRAGAGELAEAVRVGHLETVQESLARFGASTLPPLTLQLYWTLYCGVLAHWIDDRSPRQEDTLALLDQSLNMFARWLRSETDSNAQDRL